MIFLWYNFSRGFIRTFCSN